MRVCSDITEAIGNTPMIRLKRISPISEVYGKAEGMNPGGSTKDRAALFMIRDAERNGALREGMTIIEPTSGNTGIGLAMIGAYLGYDCVIVMPDTMSAERISLMRAYGAEVVLTPGAEGMAGAVKRAEELKEERGGFIASQFSNPSNAMAHTVTTAAEILEQVPEGDYVVAGIGTGGTAIGIAKGLRKYASKAKVIGVEPASSPLITEGRAGPHGIQGIGANFVPDLLDLSVIERVITVSDGEAVQYARRLAREEGLFAGISSGAAVAAAMKVSSEHPDAKVVAILPDRGDRYISTGLFD